MTVEIALFLVSVVIHLLVLMGDRKLYEDYQGALGTAVIIIGGPAFAFKRKGVGLIAQIKSCPKWMWQSAIVIAAYGIATTSLFIFSTNVVFTSSFVGSAFPLGFEVIPICILYSSIGPHHLDESQFLRNCMASVIFVILGIIWALAAHHGILVR